MRNKGIDYRRVDNRLNIDVENSRSSKSRRANNAKQLTNINSIPVRTWSWLGVNDIAMEGGFTIEDMEKIPFSYQWINESSFPGKFEPMNEDKIMHSIFNTLTYDGIGEKVNRNVMKEYNTGFYLETNKGAKVKEPIHIDFAFEEEQTQVIDNNAILAREGSEVTVIANYQSKTSTKAFHNGLTRIYCEKGATVNYIIFQRLSKESTHLGACLTKLEEAAKVNYIIVELGAKESITNVRTDLIGDQCGANMYTVYMGDEDRVIDINYLMNHYGRETKSNIDVKGVLQEQCNKIFKGTLNFEKGASKSTGSEEEYVVLLSDKVRNRSVPILLCTEEDVSGQHAASAGKIDEDKLFYLMTRGFRETEAKKLIIEAAIRPIIDRIPEEDTRNTIYEEIRRELTDES